MNTDILSVNNRKHEKRTAGLNVQNDKHNNSDNPQVNHRTLSSQVSDNLSNWIEQKQKPNLVQACYTSSSTKNTHSITDKPQINKLVDRKQVSKPSNLSDKKAFLLDTYARIAASNNRCCPKRVRELAKPRRQIRNDPDDRCINFDLNFRHTSKTYTERDNIENSRKR